MEFDRFAGRIWIYPNNLTVRPYQKHAVQLALFKNAMIVLPTGFGKTFIAAVVMYNFWRWYPQGKIIFMAPTRPLVAQQINECKQISGIPYSDCVELTGSTPNDKRQLLWDKKRVFFATPQVINNDLQNQLVQAKTIKCIVIDEAHKAQGHYPYVEIVKLLQQGNKDGFRVLALSATPGSNIERVKQVMINLFINEVMFRREDSLELMPFKNKKVSKAWTVELTGKHKSFVDRFVKITKPIFRELHRAGLTYSADSVERASKFVILMSQNRLRQNEVANVGSNKGKLMFYCTSAMALVHAFELLTIYGIRVFYSHVRNSFEENRSALKTALAGQVEFDVIMNEIEEMFGEDSEPDQNKVTRCDLTRGHPKLHVVKDLLIKHFDGRSEGEQTRAIVFTKYRESVIDIVQTLKPYEPVIKAQAFVGQGSRSAGKSGMKQREQIAAIKEFKEGKYNVLVATCVAEEGLDIGEVDLIICFDTSVSPISNTQRRGRTGRKRSGDVQTLLTKGYEEKKLNKAGASRRQVEDQLYNKDNYISCRYNNAPRMVPIDLNPTCLEQQIFPVNNEPESSSKPKRKRRRTREQVEETPKSLKKSDKKCFDEESTCEEVWNEQDSVYGTQVIEETLPNDEEKPVVCDDDDDDIDWGSELDFNCV